MFVNKSYRNICVIETVWTTEKYRISFYIKKTSNIKKSDIYKSKNEDRFLEDLSKLKYLNVNTSWSAFCMKNLQSNTAFTIHSIHVQIQKSELIRYDLRHIDDLWSTSVIKQQKKTNYSFL